METDIPLLLLLSTDSFCSVSLSSTGPHSSEHQQKVRLYKSRQWQVIELTDTHHCCYLAHLYEKISSEQKHKVVKDAYKRMLQVIGKGSSETSKISVYKCLHLTRQW